MTLQFQIGLNAISSYRRLAYTPWHAIAEFVDNSTQSYINNREALEAAFAVENDHLDIGITYDRDDGLFSIADNAMGMDLSDIEGAMRIAFPPDNPNGRSKYGLGMKTAAGWMGDHWRIRTTKLGVDKEYVVDIDVRKIEAGDGQIALQTRGAPAGKHYTIIEITDLHRTFQTRTIGKIGKHLQSMYRKDFDDLGLVLRWRSQELKWPGFEGRLLKDKQGREYRREFRFEVDGKIVTGWAGILFKGGRPEAGFSVLQNRRVIKGWPDSWRPYAIFGEERNDLINQRLVGEIHLDGFPVSHTKDDIQWERDQEQLVEKALKEQIHELLEQARTFRKGDVTPGRGPSSASVDKATSQIETELQSPEMIEKIDFEDVPDEGLLTDSLSHIADQVQDSAKPTINATVGRIKVIIYVEYDLSPNDPYVVLDSADPEEVVVIINMNHPFVRNQIEGDEGVLNYFRHCIYDAVAEAKARLSKRPVTSNSLKMMKDSLLRVTFEMQQSADAETPEVAEPEDA